MKQIGLLLFFCCTLGMAYGQSIERVDPPNWWVGMQHQQIQVLVYGPNIGTTRPQLNYPGVTLLQTTQVQNPNYLFLELDITSGTATGTISIQFLKEGNQVATHDFPLLARTPGAADQEGFSAADAIYLITPDRFVNGNASNDNVAGMKESVNRQFKGGRHGGDIKGIEQQLDYIKNLGFTAVWLNPLLENDMAEYSYHGYSTTDFYKVDSRFGSNEEYRALAEAGRTRGLKLIMDMIVNHCGSEHWWMKDLPSSDWINQWPTYTETNHRKTLLQDPYASDIDRKVFTDGWFVPTMPDLNQRNELMAQYLIQNSIWWVEYLGLSGIRMDTYPYPDMEFMTDWTRALMREYPDLNIVGEEWFEAPTIVSYWQKGKINPNGYESDLKSVMDFPLQMTMTKALNNEESWKTGWIEIYELLAQDFLYPDPSNLVIFPDNHDMSRIYTQLDENYDRFKQAMVFTLTMRGIPQIYYGTEILMTNPGTTDHGIIRSDFPGGWQGDSTNGFTGTGLTPQQKTAQQDLTQLLQWRKTASAIHQGQLKHFLPKAGIYVYFRYDEQQKIMVVLSKNAEKTTLELDRFAEVLDGNAQAKNVLTGQTHSLKTALEIPAEAALILELE
ncbi:MAG: glycoside hydrolase family 13 protein [Bacteroidota bacterium]